jgi:DNA polymerase-3 subunit gamma/tau
MQILDSLADQNVHNLLEVCTQMAAKSVDFINVIDDLTIKIHQISLLQFAPDLDTESIADKPQLLAYVQRFDKETMQLFYQIALLGKRDMYLAPDLRTGMEMTLLRMIAFTPASSGSSVQTDSPRAVATARADPSQKRTDTSHKASAAGTRQASSGTANTPVAGKPGLQADSSTLQPSTGRAAVLNSAGWPEFAQSFRITGFAREVVLNSVLRNYHDNMIELGVDKSCSHLVNDKRKALIQNAFCDALGVEITLKISVGELHEKTPQQLNQKLKDENLQKAETSIMNDPNIKELMDTLDASIIPGSIKAT